MSASSFLLGVCPGYDTIGVAAPIVLVLLRLLQPLSASGQCAGAYIFAYETGEREKAATSRKGLYLGVAIGTATSGFVFAFATAAAVESSLSTADTDY